MSLEQAILDRLEKRNAQIAQLQSTIQALESAADAERERARQQLAPLIEENKKLAAQIESDEKMSRSNREHAEYQIASLTAEVAKLRAEVQPESTREALKNAVAKLQEVTTDRDRVLNELAAILAEANKSGRCNGDPVALIKQGQNDLDALRSLERKYAALDNVTANCKIVCDRWAKIAYDCGRMDGEDAGEFIQRMARQSAHGISQATKYEELQVAHIKLQDELAKATAKLKPLETLYKTLKGYQGSDSIIGHGTIIEVAIDKATEALSQLTA